MVSLSGLRINSQGEEEMVEVTGRNLYGWPEKDV